MRTPPYSLEAYRCVRLRRTSTWVPPASWFVLKTCQRFECWFHHSEVTLPAEDILSYEFGMNALARLVMVACGGESDLLGETEVMGQIKAQYALQSASLSRPLHWFLQTTLWAAKAIRTAHPLHSGPSSYGGWVRKHLQQRHFFASPSAAILFVGSGRLIHEIAHFVAIQARTSEAQRRFFWMNRTTENAHKLAAQFGGEVLPFSPSEVAAYPGVIVGISQADALRPHWSAAWEQWADRWAGSAALVCDLSSPQLVPEHMTSHPDVLTLADLRDLPIKEQSRRREKKALLHETIHQWLYARITSTSSIPLAACTG